MERETIYIDLSKCSEEEIKEIPQILEKAGETIGENTIFESDDFSYWTNFHKPNYADYWTVGTSNSTPEKTELTYPEFIKLFEGGEEKKSKAATFILGQIDKAIQNAEVENIKDIAYTEGVLVGLKICKELWAQGTISHEMIQEEIYHYQEELENLNSNK